MKVTAIIPDELVEKVRKLSCASNTTEAFLKALREWVSLRELSAIVEDVKKRPLRFSSDYSASKIRTLNRKRT